VSETANVNEGYLHQILVQGNPTAARALIEARLGVETETRPLGDSWGIYFHGPRHLNLDFLRPDVLPPL